MDEGLGSLYRLSIFREGQLVDFDGGKVREGSGLGAGGLQRGSPAPEDATAGVVKAFTAEFGHLGPAHLAWS